MVSPTPSGRMSAPATLSFPRRLEVPVDEAWAWLTDSSRTARWFGPWAGDPRSGTVHVTMTAEADGPPQAATVVECEAPRLLVLRMGPADDPWVLTLEVTADGDGSTVTLSQRVDDVEAASQIGPGWDFYLDRLVAAQTGGDVEAIAFEPDYLPGMAEYYRSLYS